MRSGTDTRNATGLLTEPTIGRRLGQLRRWIWAYVTLEGLAWMAIWSGGLFWASAALDWMFELSRGARGVLLLGTGMVLLAVAWSQLVGRLGATIPPAALAALVERRDPSFRGSLRTFVELAARRAFPSKTTEQLVVETGHRAAAKFATFPLAPLLRWGRLAVRGAGGLAAASSIPLMALAFPAVWNAWSARFLRLEDQPWPRWTSLEVVGFQSGVVKVARGEDFELMVRADANKWIPDIVQVRFRTEEGSRGRENMSRQGRAVPGRDAFQEYTHRFVGVLSSMHLEVRGGDARLFPLRIEVVESPAVVEMTARCEYPAYTGRLPAEALPVTRSMRFPRGSRVILQGKSNKPLERVEITSGREGAEAALATLEGSDVADRQFTYAIDALMEDQELRFRLADTDGIRARSAMRVFLAVEPDKPPLVLVRIQGIGTAITPRARIPFQGRIEDDYGIESAWIEYECGETLRGTQPVAWEGGGLLRDAVLDVPALKLEPGQRLLVGVQARDHCDVEGPNVGEGQRYGLDVVSAGRLRAMLEARELALKERLETIVDDLAATRDSLGRVELGNPNWSTATDAPRGEVDSLSRLRVGRARQNAQRSSQEVRELAAAFDDIREQLTNNRLEVEGWNERLQNEIVTPLRDVAERAFPHFEKTLLELEKSFSGNEPGAERLALAREQAELILIRLRRILEKMLKLESYHELLDTLREIISGQDALRKETEERRKRKVLELLQE